jgi:hypothetical protein
MPEPGAQGHGLRQLRRNDDRSKLDPAILNQTAIPSCLAPCEKLARMHAVALRNRADTRPRLQRLGDNLLLIRRLQRRRRSTVMISARCIVQ